MQIFASSPVSSFSLQGKSVLLADQHRISDIRRQLIV
jgi:hypothetical protein